MSILDTAKKINIWGLVAVCFVLSVGLVVGTMKISAFSAQKTPIRIDSSKVVNTEPLLASEVTDGTKVADQTSVVASKTGSKYHLPDCPGAKQIIEKNKIVFLSINEAERAGYTPASNCKGLKTND